MFRLLYVNLRKLMNKIITVCINSTGRSVDLLKNSLMKNNHSDYSLLVIYEPNFWQNEDLIDWSDTEFNNIFEHKNINQHGSTLNQYKGMSMAFENYNADAVVNLKEGLTLSPDCLDLANSMMNIMSDYDHGCVQGQLYFNSIEWGSSPFEVIKVHNGHSRNGSVVNSTQWYQYFKGTWMSGIHAGIWANRELDGDEVMDKYMNLNAHLWSWAPSMSRIGDGRSPNLVTSKNPVNNYEFLNKHITLNRGDGGMSFADNSVS